MLRELVLHSHLQDNLHVYYVPLQWVQFYIAAKQAILCLIDIFIS